MRRVFNFLVAALVLTVSLNGCEGEDPAEAMLVDWERTATIKGHIFVVDDFTTIDPKLVAPEQSKVKITALVPYYQLLGNANGFYVVPAEKIKYTAASGLYEIEAPVGPSGTDVYILFEDFSGTVKKFVANKQEEISGFWRASEFSQYASELVGGETRNLDDILLYGNSSSNFLETQKVGDYYYGTATLWGRFAMYQDLTKDDDDENYVSITGLNANDFKVTYFDGGLVDGKLIGEEVQLLASKIRYEDGYFFIEVPAGYYYSLTIEILNDKDGTVRIDANNTRNVTWLTKGRTFGMNPNWIYRNSTHFLVDLVLHGEANYEGSHWQSR